MGQEELLKSEKKYQQIEKLRAISIPVSIGFAALIIGAFLFLLLVMKVGINKCFILLLFLPLTGIYYLIIDGLCNSRRSQLSATLEQSVLDTLGISDWMFNKEQDAFVSLKSSQAVNKYDEIKFFKEDSERLPEAVSTMRQKQQYARKLKTFLKANEYKEIPLYEEVAAKIENNLQFLDDYYVIAEYTSPAGKKSTMLKMTISFNRIKELVSDKSILMGKSEYNSYIKEQRKAQLEQKQHSFYERVNATIDNANYNKDKLVNRKDVDELDRLVNSLFDRTANSIKKVKFTESEEWDMLNEYISNIEKDVESIVHKNNQILAYYNSNAFLRIKAKTDALMSSQREFNAYIDEKVQSISSLFGTAIVRNETVNEDEYNYIHSYKKSITPFTAEVSATVFASAENNPLEYVVKYFYPTKERYPEQIQKLHTLVEELETLKEAKQIIENSKDDIHRYLNEVPEYIMNNDEDGFYSRLGFATINENVLVVEYKFSYTSNGGRAQRSFTVPMTEENIIKLIEVLEGRLTLSAFTKEQRALMTSKLRQFIKERDGYTCKFCGNSIYKEPNLLLEIDHIIPIAKGGTTEANNLQTLCWKCNRQKSSKIL